MRRARAALARGRRQAERLMIDQCIIRRRTGEVVTDPETGEVTPVLTTIYEGKCKVQSKDSATASPEAGEHAYTVVSRQVHIPVNAAEVKDNDVAEITASAVNAFTVGKQYVVRGFTPDTYDTAARLPVKEVTS